MISVKIEIEGKLSENWEEWLEGLTITHLESGNTFLTGQIRDQAALYGLITKLRDLGATLITVNVGSQGSP